MKLITVLLLLLSNSAHAQGTVREIEPPKPITQSTLRNENQCLEYVKEKSTYLSEKKDETEKLSLREQAFMAWSNRGVLNKLCAIEFVYVDPFVLSFDDTFYDVVDANQGPRLAILIANRLREKAPTLKVIYDEDYEFAQRQLDEFSFRRGLALSDDPYTVPIVDGLYIGLSGRSDQTISIENRKIWAVHLYASVKLSRGGFGEDDWKLIDTIFATDKENAIAIAKAKLFQSVDVLSELFNEVRN
jgi:hypothetical protein